MKNAKRFISYIVVLFMLLQLTGIASSAINTADEVDDNNYSNSAINDVDLKPIISSPISNVSEAIRVSFDSTDVLSYNIQTEGLNAIEVSGDLISYDITATEEFGTLNFYATYEDDVVKQISVYTYKYDNVVYVSDVSEEQAWYDCMKQRFDNEEITATEFQALYDQLTNRYHSEYIPENGTQNENNAPNGMTIINGTLNWEVNSTTVVPLISSKVELIKLVDGNEIVIDTEYTLTDGSFKFEIMNDEWSSSGEDILIRLRLESITYALKTDWWIDHYYFDSEIRHDVLPGTTESFYKIIHYDENSNHYKAAYVHQAMTIAERFAMEMSAQISNHINSGNPKLEVAYPAEIVGDSAFCFGNDLQSIAMIGTENYKEIDVITHEYAHYVQYIMNIYGATLGEIINNWPTHDIFADHFVDKEAKEYAMELTWSEAWANLFSTLAQNYYSSASEYTHFANPPSYYYESINLEDPNAHNKYTAFDNNKQDSIGEQDNRGESQELAVAAFLYDLYDNSNEYFDNISWGYQWWWFYTTRPGIYTLEDFVQRMDDSYPAMRGNIALILEEHMISPKITNVSTYSPTTPPTVSFVVNGSESNPNNRFVIYFYDENGNYLGESEMIESNVAHRETVTYSIPSILWSNVVEAAVDVCNTDTVINISIGGYRYDTILVSDSSRAYSGPYFSSYSTLIIQLNHNYALNSVDNTYHTYTCSRCDHSETTEHNMRYKMYADLGKHGYKCVDCGYVDEDSLEAHSYNYWAYLNPTTHISECTCGARGTTTAPHAFVAPDIFSLERVCVGCGYTKIAGSDIGQIILSIQKVSLNGSYILPDGNIVLVDEDVEAYLNGTLVFYDKDNLPVTQ